MPHALLFSDVDGTMLRADGEMAVDRDALAAHAGWLQLVLASSRTVAELSLLQRMLGVGGVMVAENGAVVAFDEETGIESGGVVEEHDGRRLRLVALGAPASELAPRIRETAARIGVVYTDQQALGESLGTADDALRRALWRTHSVLIRPAPGTDRAAFDELLATLRLAGLEVSSGGQWIAITRGADKGTGVRYVREAFARAGREFRVTAGVGDADNDIPLLRAVDRPFVIRRDDGSWEPALVQVRNAERLMAYDLGGWRDVLRFLAPDSGRNHDQRTGQAALDHQRSHHSEA